MKINKLKKLLEHLFVDDNVTKEQERLAKIGKATEKAFKLYNQSYFGFFAIGRDCNLDTEIGGIINNTEELLCWYGKEVNNEK